MTELVFPADDGTPVTTSLVIAENTGVQHKSLVQLIRSYIDDLNDVGRVAFETRPFETAGGTQRREVAQLDEPASALLMTYLKNTEIVRDFKKRLVRGFYELRAQLTHPSVRPVPTKKQLAQWFLEAEERAEKAEAKVVELAAPASACGHRLDLPQRRPVEGVPVPGQLRAPGREAEPALPARR